jgi:glycerol-3-phosphate acyltransferase PlsX
MNIGIDIMGGDFAPSQTVRGALLAAQDLPPSTKLVLTGHSASIEQELKNADGNPDLFPIVHSNSVIEMGDNPTRSFSQKSDSSITKGFQLLKNGEIDACVGAGNTGAMCVGSVLSVKPIEGIQRPCIISLLPKESGGFGVLLDVGANADCKPETMYQFAILGSIYASSISGIKDPKVGLINIGEEQEKGNATGIVGHGNSNSNTIKNMVTLAHEVVNAKFTEKIKAVLNHG